MPKVLRRVTDLNGDLAGYRMRCPGCIAENVPHRVPIHFFRTVPAPNGREPTWEFDQNLKRPTFSPSLRCRADWWNPETKRYDIKLCCHFFLRNGRLEFLDDCTHPLAGQTVDMIPVDS